MPEEDGLSLVRYLKQPGNVPIIMLTATASPIDRVVGLELGADDYLAKPVRAARASGARPLGAAPQRGGAAAAAAGRAATSAPSSSAPSGSTSTPARCATRTATSTR